MISLFQMYECCDMRDRLFESGDAYLFEGHEDLLPLAEVSEEEMERSRHERRVVMHCQVQ